MNLGLVMVGLVTACCLDAVPARAVGPEVRDNAGLFSARAVKQADAAIRNIQKDYRKDLLVETFPGVPEGRTEDYTRDREGFFSNFVRERAQAARLDGIYVLVMKEPPPHRFRIQVGVGQATRQRAFTPMDRDELVRLFQSSFRDDKYDDGLRNAVAFVERTLRSNLQIGTLERTAQGMPVRPIAPSNASSSHSSIGSLLVLALFVVGGVLVVGFLVRLLRGGMGGGGGLTGAGGLSGGGGGGFFSSLLGGIGGAMAGSWLYDRFLGGNARAADSFTSNQPDAPPSDVGGDFSSSGGDVDSGAGGGDFGGGGDMGGGGDFGGGGDA